MHQDQVLGGSYSGLALLVGSWESPAPSLSLDFCKETPRPHRVGTQGGHAGQSGDTKAPHSSPSDSFHMGLSSEVQLFKHSLLPLSPSLPPLPPSRAGTGLRSHL